MQVKLRLTFDANENNFKISQNPQTYSKISTHFYLIILFHFYII